jgi:hypothetical protein
MCLQTISLVVVNLLLVGIGSKEEQKEKIEVKSENTKAADIGGLYI